MHDLPTSRRTRADAATSVSKHHAPKRKKAGEVVVGRQMSRSVLVAAWFYAKAFKARRADGVESVELKESVSKVRACSLPTHRCLSLTNPCPIP